MFKQIVVLVAVSIAIILFMAYAQQGVQLLVQAHDWVWQILTDVFSVGQAGNVSRGLIALLAIPVLVGLIPAIVYWMVRGHWFPYFMQIVWVVWLIQAGALIALFQTVAAATAS